MKYSDRNSSFELLRILCIFGIILMHLFSPLYFTCAGKLRVYGVVINCIGNMGVTIFMMISGYFGIKFSVKRLIEIECMMIFYGLLSVVLNFFLLNKPIDGESIIKACMPISHKKYWFMSVYIIIFCLSSYINFCLSNLDKKQFRIMLFVLILFFYVLPFITKYSITEDGGKGIPNMLSVYIIGRYVRIYKNEKVSPWKYLLGAVSVILLNILYNYLLIYMSKGDGLEVIQCGDLSLLILASSYLVFMYFKNIKISSKCINIIASFVLSIYLFEDTIRNIILKYVSINNGVIFVFFNLLISFLTVICIIVIEFVRKKVLGNVEPLICRIVSVILNRIEKIIGKYEK